MFFQCFTINQEKKIKFNLSRISPEIRLQKSKEKYWAKYGEQKSNKNQPHQSALFFLHLIFAKQKVESNTWYVIKLNCDVLRLSHYPNENKKQKQNQIRSV